MVWYAANKIFPNWHVWNSYVANSPQKALNLDSLQSSHPVELFVWDSTIAKQMYDEISYEKGSCVLRMVLNNLGEEKFFHGLKLYLDRYQYQSTESRNLWQAWEEVTGEPMTTNMRIWTKEPGFPVVIVAEHLDESGRAQGYRLQQRRFLASGDTNADNLQHPVYPLQIAIRSESGVDIADMRSHVIIVPTSGELFKANADHGGFFRTSYSAPLLNRLLEEVSKGTLSLCDSIGLSCDFKALVAAGLNQTSELLDLSLIYREMGSFYVWEMIDQNPKSIQSVLKFHDHELQEALRKAALAVLGPKAHELGYDISEDDEDVLVSFKASIFSNTGLAGDKE